jgi:hypothetical protein
LICTSTIVLTAGPTKLLLRLSERQLAGRPMKKPPLGLRSATALCAQLTTRRSRRECLGTVNLRFTRGGADLTPRPRCCYRLSRLAWAASRCRLRFLIIDADALGLYGMVGGEKVRNLARKEPGVGGLDLVRVFALSQPVHCRQHSGLCIKL